MSGLLKTPLPSEEDAGAVEEDVEGRGVGTSFGVRVVESTLEAVSLVDGLSSVAATFAGVDDGAGIVS